MGREFIAAARKQLAFIEDPLLARYVETLGRRLAGSLEGDTASLRFFSSKAGSSTRLQAPEGGLPSLPG